MATTTDLGSSPNYFMPVIEPPATGVDPATYYSGLNLTIMANNFGNNGINYIITTPPTPINNYLMVDGSIHFIKSGDNFPIYLGVLGGTMAVYNSLIIHVNPISSIDLKKRLPPGVPPAEYIIIEKVDETTFTTDITAHINDVISNQASYNNGKSPYNSNSLTKVMDLFWLENQNTNPALAILNDKINLLVTNIKQGSLWLSCKAGLKLGTILYDSNADANFNIKMIEASGIDLISPILYLRNMILLPDETKGEEMWTDHPLITSISAFTTPLDIYLKFEIWNPLSLNDANELEYIPIDAGCEVKLMDYDPLNSDDQIGTSMFTDANGCIEWHFPNIPAGGVGDTSPDLYFIISTPSSTKINQYNVIAQAPIILPVEWSTKASSDTDYWNSVDGSPGYIENFQGLRLGAQVSPMTFRVGVDYHFKLNSYQTSSAYLEPIAYMPGIDIKITDGNQVFETQSTNEEGVIFGLSFNIPPNKNLYAELDFSIEDSSINLQTTRVAYTGIVLPPTGLAQLGHNSTDIYTWKSKNEDPSSRFYFENNAKTTLKSEKVERDANNNEIIPIRHLPFELKPEKNNANYALFILKTIKELHIFLNILTNGQWLGRPVDIKMYHFFDFATTDTTATSYPNGVVWLAKTWHRGAVIHEYSHQIMWEQSSYSDIDIVSQFVWDGVSDFDFVHYHNGYSTLQRSLTEGWAAAIEAIFVSTNPKSLNILRNGQALDIDSGNSNFDIGYHSEGSFSNTLVNLFWKYVVEESNQSNWNLIESKDGNLIAANNQWLIGANINNIKDNFLNIIWHPLSDLSSQLTFAMKTTDLFTEYVKNNNNGSGTPNIWYKLRSEFLLWNTTVNGFGSQSNTIKAPTVNNVFPNLGAISGTNNVVINGSNFFKSSFCQNSFREVRIDVYFGIFKVDTSKVTILTENDINVEVPPALVAGLVDVKLDFFVRNKVIHTEILSNGYEYV